MIGLLVSCASKKSYVTDNQSQTSVQISGQIIDPYIVGATVCCDKNRNHLCDTDEVSATSNATGNYSFQDSCPNNSTIIAVGGTDSVTNIENNLQKAIHSPDLNFKININPITTILSDISVDKHDRVMSALFSKNVNYEIYQSDFYDDCNQSTDDHRLCCLKRLFN